MENDRKCDPKVESTTLPSWAMDRMQRLNRGYPPSVRPHHRKSRIEGPWGERMFGNLGWRNSKVGPT